MKIKGNGCSALIVAAGLWVCLAGSSQAVTATDTAATRSTTGAPIPLNKYTRHSSRHHKSSKVALKSTDDKDETKAAGTDAAAGDADKSSIPPPSSSEIPPSIANANAQLAASDSPTGDAAQAMSVRATNITQNAAANDPAATPPAAEDQVVAADQLNDVDRALHEGKAPVAPLATASAEPPVPSAAPVTAGSAARSSDSTWDQTSLIGKIFIGFGALLTMASAARMFMA